jgi:hypothetical protein
MAKKPFSQEEIQDIKEYKQYLDDTITRYKSLQEELKKYNKYVTSNAKEAVKAQLVEITKQVGTYKEITSELKKYQSLVNKIEEQEKKINQQTKERANDTETIVENLKEQNKELEEQAKRIKNLGDDWGDIDDLQTSISSAYGKQYGDVGAIQKKIDGTKAIVSSISEVLKNDSKSYEDQLDKILEISERYKEFPADFARMNKERKRGTLTEKGMLDQLRDNLDEFDEMISKIQITNEETEKLVEFFKQLRNEQEAFNNAQKTKYEAKSISGEISGRYFGGAPVIGDALSSGLKMTGNLFSGETIAGATLAGVAYMITKASAYMNAMDRMDKGGDVMDTFIGKARRYDVDIDQLQKEMDRRAKMVELNEGFTANFAKFDFGTEMEQLETQFDKVSKTAFFGNQLGSVKYAKDQLELAGIGAEVIASTMSEMSSGANSSMQELSEDVAVFSKKTGIASSQIASLTKIFRMLDKTGGTDAFNTLQQSLSKTLEGGINIADIANEMANANETALFYNVKSSEELIKQIVSVRKLGGEYTKIAEAGKSMVLNYRDTIRKSMELSTMLGEQVDLGEVMALFASNRPEDAFRELKDSGLLEKVQNSSMQARETFNQIFPMIQLAGPNYETGPNQGLKSNKEFLKSFQDAAVQQKIDAAEIDVKQAIIRMGAQPLEYGLIGQLGNDPELAGLDLQITKKQIQKFLDVEASQVGQGLFPSVVPKESPLYKPSNPNLKQPRYDFPLPGMDYQFKFNQSPTVQPKSEGSPIASISKPLESSDKSLKRIDIASTTQAKLLENIQTLTAAMSGLSTDNIMKLVVDGKELNTRLEKVKTQQLGKTRV